MTVHSYDREGNEYDEVLHTATGKIVTEADIAEWAAEAEEGYEFDHAFQPMPSDELVCQRCEKRQHMHKTLTPRERPSRPLFGPWLP